ncbi:MAG: hypothetical protein AB7V32_10595 [Candidatus Berkiella sp.]
MKILLLGILMNGLLVSASCFAQTKPLPDDEAKDLIIRGNISAFEGDCPCPYSEDKDRQTCGENSAYHQNPGSIKCYPGDISAQELNRFREQYNIEEPKMPWDKEKRPGY